MTDVLERTDFSRNSAVYDRRHGAAISDRLARAIGSCLRPGDTVVDVGAGTGRVAVALSRIGVRVVALDPAVPMLQVLRQKSGEHPVVTVAADGCRFPLRGRSAGGVVLARILYLLPDWRGLLRNCKEVLREGGFLFHEWANGEDGEPWVLVREKARSLFEEAGSTAPFHLGARSEQTVDSYLQEIGFLERERVDGGPGTVMTLEDFLRMLEGGELSYVWNVSADVRDSCLPTLREWCERELDLCRPVPVPARLYWTIYEKVG